MMQMCKNITGGIVVVKVADRSIELLPHGTVEMQKVDAENPLNQQLKLLKKIELVSADHLDLQESTVVVIDEVAKASKDKALQAINTIDETVQAKIKELEMRMNKMILSSTVSIEDVNKKLSKMDETCQTIMNALDNILDKINKAPTKKTREGVVASNAAAEIFK